MRQPQSIPGLGWAVKALESARRCTLHRLGAGLLSHRTPSGTALWRAGERPFFAELTAGSGGGPYNFRRVAWKDGVWVQVTAADDPAVAYEANLVHPGVPKIVRMIPSGLAGEYRFTRPRGEPGISYHECDPCPIPRTDLILDWPAGLATPITLAYKDALVTPESTVPEEPFGVDRCTPWQFLFDIGQSSPYWISAAFEATGLGSFEPSGGPPPPYYARWILVCGLDGLHGTDPLSGRVRAYLLLWTSEAAAEAALDEDPGGDALNLDGIIGIGADTFVEGVGWRCRFYYDPKLRPEFITAACCSPFRLAWPGVVIRSGAGSVPTSQEVCVTVLGLGCDGEDGPPVEGAAVLVVGALESPGCTTNSQGACCVTVTHGGDYEVGATKDGCTDGGTFEVFVCNSSISATVVLCCAKVRFTVVDDETDEPIPGAVILIPGLIEFETDEDGIALTGLPIEYLQNLPVPAEDCQTRTVLGPTVTAENVTVGEDEVTYLYRCLSSFNVSCGATTEIEVRLAKFPPGWLIDTWGCCPGDECTSTGPSGRRLFPEEVELDIGLDRYNSGGFVVYEINFANLSMSLDHARYDATGRKTYRSGCQSITPFSILCEEGEPGEHLVTYSSIIFELETCRSGGSPAKLYARIFDALGCPDAEDYDPLCTSGTQITENCAGEDICLEMTLDNNVGAGARSDRICWGEHLDADGTVGGGGGGVSPWAWDVVITGVVH